MPLQLPPAIFLADKTERILDFGYCVLRKAWSGKAPENAEIPKAIGHALLKR